MPELPKAAVPPNGAVLASETWELWGNQGQTGQSQGPFGCTLDACPAWSPSLPPSVRPGHTHGSFQEESEGQSGFSTHPWAGPGAGALRPSFCSQHLWLSGDLHDGVG